MPDVSSRTTSDAFDFEGDGDDARQWLDTAYGTSLGLSGPMGTVHARRSDVGGVSFDRLRIDAPVRFDAQAMPVLVVVDVLAGEVEYTHGRVTDRGRSGDTVLAAGWDMPFTGGGAGYEVRNTGIPDDVMSAAIAEIDQERTSADLEFASFVPRSPSAAAQWRAVVDNISSTPASAAGDSLAQREASRLLAHSLLHTFENNIGGSSPLSARDMRDATHATVRRAQGVIDARAQDDLTLADLAQECHVTPRALQYAFRRHLDCTPHAYLRRVRLDLVHQALRDGSVHSVGDAAARFGFFNPGRFAAEYRQVFGENPRQTLVRHTP